MKAQNTFFPFLTAISFAIAVLGVTIIGVTFAFSWKFNRQAAWRRCNQAETWLSNVAQLWKHCWNCLLKLRIESFCSALLWMLRIFEFRLKHFHWNWRDVKNCYRGLRSEKHFQSCFSSFVMKVKKVTFFYF